MNLVKELMGHASIVTTQRYLHSQADEKKQAIESLTAKHPKMWKMSGKGEFEKNLLLKASGRTIIYVGNANLLFAKT